MYSRRRALRSRIFSMKLATALSRFRNSLFAAAFIRKPLFLAALACGALPQQSAAQDGSTQQAPAQDQGQLSGDLQMNVNFYDRDTTIFREAHPLYDKAMSGGEGWLSLRYAWKGFTATVRVDAFHNSILYNPLGSFTGFGIGAFSLSKDINSLNVTGGYIYDQIGSGILFRAYEDRGLLIDNALVGLRLRYQVNDHLFLKGFTGQQKNVATITNRYQPIIKAFQAEGDFNAGKTAHLGPGIGVLQRTMDEGSITSVAGAINNQDSTLRFVPRYNTYAFTAYNNLTAGDISWYVEGAYKTHEAIDRGDKILRDESGMVLYSTLSVARKGIAVNVTGKRTENFALRTSPNEVAPRGVINWQPIVARLRPQRLMARYSPASQDFSEQAFNVDLLLSPNDNVSITTNYTHINKLDGVKLYREAYGEAEYRGLDKWLLQGGVQVLEYNQELYQVKPGYPLFRSVTPFVEATYRITNKKSIRLEVEYMDSKQDYGSWAFALLEYNIAPNWSFAVSDMYNVKPTHGRDDKHFYNIFTAYSKGPHRFTLQYVKQVEGINCTGGVCRYEPAFSGARFGVTTSF